MLPTTINLNATKQRAFTLKELLILMVGIVVVVSIALPVLSNQKFKTQYRAAAVALSAHKSALIRYAYRYDNYWGLPDTELSPAEMKQYFGIDDSGSGPNLDPIRGMRNSMYSFSVYQYLHKRAFSAPEEAPELVAMKVYLTRAGEFDFTYHYYHSDYDWDYAAGAKYVDIDDFDDLINE